MKQSTGPLPVRQSVQTPAFPTPKGAPGEVCVRGSRDDHPIVLLYANPAAQL